MAVGRLTHYAFDLALISTILAGIKRNSGYSVKFTTLPEGFPQNIVSSYLALGENAFDYLSNYSIKSSSFKRVPANSSANKGKWVWGS
ncbi:hypothetical protein BY996DRAFT_4601562 [Phakopsora pachyrhizi]|uniref:DUF1748-domain-containing protein n=1 Tax=Phakopsora pachyrhizi TaxID=170000 RepID=A0A0S1MJP4_PHAPC|nr:hypothetical protein BY996DRAFT_4601562 [Phakopsora pachyrhizi]CAH7686340.1 hypothetical protein PPACK8108_LOCUS20978 [Phakopsora pachyrhizi]